MSFSPQLNKKEDYSTFGFEPESQEQSSLQPIKKQNQYQDYGFEPEKTEQEKLGAWESIGAGLIEGTYGLAQSALEGPKKGFDALGEFVFGKENMPSPKPQDKDRFALDKLSWGIILDPNKESKVNEALRNLPESKDEWSRRLRVASQAAPISAIGGVSGIIQGLVGSQAGQTIREVFGKEGKFQEFGLGESAAILVDALAGFGANAGYKAAKNYSKTPVNNTSPIFKDNKSSLEKRVVKNTLQNEEKALQNVIDNFSQEQLRGFEQESTALSADRFSEMTESNASAIKRNADNMFRDGQLDTITPIRATSEQSGRALQETANTVFNDEVIAGERAAYSNARKEAEGLSGSAPRTLREAKTLRESLTKNEPTPEQRAVVSYLDDLISDLETVTPAKTQQASKLLDSSGKPFTNAVEIPSSSKPTTKTANDLVDLVQKGNNAVNYGSELRLQSHRLKPILNTLREEVGRVLGKKDSARIAYQEANQLHGRNAEIWGTKYMRNMRFAENPESIVSSSKKPSNMRNMKQAITDPTMQAVGERMVVADVTQSGSSAFNRNVITNLSPELSINARNAAEQLIQVKDPLTSTGGRAALRNSILKDVASAVNTGQPPKRVLELMSTAKGYHMVRESLQATPQSRQVFNSLQRTFLEDVVTSIKDSSGQIDFSKAKNVLQNPETRRVLHEIGGSRLIERFRNLENISNNFERNIKLYSKPEAQTFVKSLIQEGKSTAILGTVLHALHVPWPVITGLGIAKAGGKVAGLTYQALERKILSNPKALHYLEQLSKAATIEELANQLPRLIKELDKED